MSNIHHSALQPSTREEKVHSPVEEIEIILEKQKLNVVPRTPAKQIKTHLNAD